MLQFNYQLKHFIQFKITRFFGLNKIAFSFEETKFSSLEQSCTQ